MNHPTSGTMKARATFRFGTSSWSEKSWNGVFYPRGTKPGDQLTFYATEFTTVEADNTYYRVPSAPLVRGWHDKTPPEFTLSAKFPRSIVHCGKSERPDGERVLVREHVASDTERFLDAMRELGPKAGPLVMQFPYFNREAFASEAPFLERLAPYLEALPKDFRYGVEVRNKNWLTRAFFDLLRTYRVGWVAVDLPYMPHPLDLPRELDTFTADFAYARLIGDRAAVEDATDTFDRIVIDQSPRIDRWAEWLAQAIPKTSETFAYTNNHFAGFAPESIRELARKVEALLD
ncbi:MAG: DUF72 domain-containing protein [Planctomycetota bacterium]|nr:DUF72 domain-containing protein [Planctomycetota bacterium]